MYADENGTEPFSEWIENLRDLIGRKRIFARIDRLVHGNYGDCKPVGDGISELRMFFGSGYRVYFAEKDDRLVVLLCGGVTRVLRRRTSEMPSYIGRSI